MSAKVYGNNKETGRVSAKVYDTDGAEEVDVNVRPHRSIFRVVRRPRRSTWLYWVTAAIADVADQVELTNQYLEEGRSAKALEAFVDVFSLRRLAPILPGGGVLRGATHPPVAVPPATPGVAE